MLRWLCLDCHNRVISYHWCAPPGSWPCVRDRSCPEPSTKGPPDVEDYVRLDARIVQLTCIARTGALEVPVPLRQPGAMLSLAPGTSIRSQPERPTPWKQGARPRSLRVRVPSAPPPRGPSTALSECLRCSGVTFFGDLQRRGQGRHRAEPTCDRRCRRRCGWVQANGGFADERGAAGAGSAAWAFRARAPVELEGGAVDHYAEAGPLPSRPSR